MTLAQKKRKIFDNRYEIVSIVGRGAASVVYHAKHLSGAGGDVALKVLLTQKGDRSNAELLRKEALAMVSARHKYVIRLDDFHSVGEIAYLSMEYAPESDLRKYMQITAGKLGPIQGQLFLIQTAEALNFTHQAGIIHRDIKPDNILVISDREVRLGDFGVAVLPGEKSSLEDLQKGVGTMSYMAPEVLEGIGYDKRSDIYALGVTFYEVISGVHPFANVPLMQQLEIRKDGAFPSLDSLVPNIPKQLNDAIMQAMRNDPADRFGSARELVQSLVGQLPAASKEAERPTKTNLEQPKAAKSAQTSSVQSEPPKPQKTTAPEEETLTETQSIDPDLVAKAQQAKPASPRVRADREQEPASKSSSRNTQIPRSKSEPVRAQNQFELGKKDASLTGAPKGIHAVERKAEDASVRQKTAFLGRDEVARLNASAKEEHAADFEEFEEEAQPRTAGLNTHLYTHPDEDRRKRRYLTLSICVFFLILAFVVSPALRQVALSRIKHSLSLDTSSEAISPIPVYSGAQITFPNLPGGSYAGYISGFVPGKRLPISIISMPNLGKLVVIIGFEGFSPAVVDLPETPENPDEDQALRIKSNGFILDLTGQLVDGELAGYFKDIVSGNQGEWAVKPVQQTASE